MTNAISGSVSNQPAYQPQQVAAPHEETKGTAPQHKDDVVTISAQGKKAVQQPVPYSPTEEMNESATQRALEAQAGKK
jgi:hypothetical protein